jgi:phospholipid/cholesterol/gamma-HCH transport system substrate-binding protein
MRRLIPIALLAVVALAVVVALLTRGGDDPYRVRAIFDNAGFVIPGEDVKVAGVKVGTIHSLDVTKDFKAVVVLDIQDKGYQDFRQDAECTIRPQSLIGERFVECTPTQKRAPGTQAPPPLKTVAGGQHLLPVSQTTKPVDLDLLNDITREPERARVSIILNELGTGLAGRGSDLDDVIRRADPALRETDKVLAILASQNRTLERLAVDGDTILQPLARERRHVASALANSAAVADATAERRDELADDIERLPAFLEELKPTMVRLGAFADQATPVLADLGAVAPDINRLIRQLGPFSEAGIPAFESLGDAAEVGTPAMIDALPVIRQLRTLARDVRPVGATAGALLSSLQKSGGFERAMDYIFYQVAAVNGFDSFGHYLRAGLIVNQCAVYAITPTPGCNANFVPQASSSAAAATAIGPRDKTLQRTAAALAAALSGEQPAGKRPAAKRSVPRLRPTPTPAPRHTRPRVAKPTPTASPAPTGSPAPAAPTPPAATPTPLPVATPTPQPIDPQDGILDYLFGGDPR